MKSWFLCLCIISLGFLRSCTEVKNDVQFEEEARVDETGLNNQNQEIYTYDNPQLKACIDSIWRVPIINELQQEIETLSQDKRTLVCLIYQEDFINTEVVQLKFGEDNGLNFVTYHSFAVYPFKNWSIYYYDVIEDEEIEFGTWVAVNEKSKA